MPLSLIRLLLATALVSGGWPVGATPVAIELRATAVISRAQVTLGDVAQLSGATPALLAQMRAMPLGATPREGHVSLTREEIERWIRRHSAMRQPELQWSGAALVEVGAVPRMIAGSEIAATAREALKNWLESRSEHSDIEQLSTPANLSAPAGLVRLSARELVETQPRTRMQVWVELRSDGQLIRTVPVSFRVRAYRTAYVVRDDMAGGRAVDVSRLERRVVDVAPAAGAALTGEEPGPDWRTRQPVRRGDVLLANQVETMPTVRRGQSATLRSQSGMLSVEAVVEVLQDGYEGQLVKVKGTGASGTVLARVVGPGLLEMTER